MTPERELLREARDELRWCSGSSDFNEGGQARKGWIKGPQAVLNKIDAFFAQPESTQQAVLDAYTRCAEICKSKMADEIATGDVDHNENAWSFICERAILAARDALKDKP